MWRAILLFWLSAVPLGLSCAVSAETIPAVQRPGLKGDCLKALKALSAGEVVRAETTDTACVGYNVHDSFWGNYSFSSLGWSDVWGCPDASWTYDAFANKCSRPDQPPTCSSAQLANYCSMIAGQAVDTARFNVGTRSRVCDNYYPKIPGCKIQEDAGCRITRNYPQVTQFKYNGQACAQVADGDPNNQNGTSPSSCAPGEYYGTVNNVTGCFGGGPVPPSDKPSTDPATGKDANGNCAAGYVGRIKNNALECIPAHEPSDGKSCPPGWNAVGIGGKTVCVDPTSGPGGGSGGTGGNTGGGTGGTPGGGGSTGGNTGGGTGGTPGKPDASSPSGEKPGECDYTGMWKFLCSDKPGAPDTSAPNLVNEGGVNLTSLLNTNDIFTRPAACPANLRIDLGEGSVELQYTLVCSFAEKARPGVIIACVVVAAFIIFRRG